MGRHDLLNIPVWCEMEFNFCYELGAHGSGREHIHPPSYALGEPWGRRLATLEGEIPPLF